MSKQAASKARDQIRTQKFEPDPNDRRDEEQRPAKAMHGDTTDAEQSYKTDKVAEAATAKPGSPWLLIVVGALIAVAVAALLSSGR